MCKFGFAPNTTTYLITFFHLLPELESCLVLEVWVEQGHKFDIGVVGRPQRCLGLLVLVQVIELEDAVPHVSYD